MPNPSEFDLTKVFRYILSPGFPPYFFSIDFVFHLVVASTALSLHEPASPTRAPTSVYPFVDWVWEPHVPPGGTPPWPWACTTSTSTELHYYISGDGAFGRKWNPYMLFL